MWVQAFNKLKDMFKPSILGKWKDKEFAVKFYKDGGGGIAMAPQFPEFRFYPNNPTQLHNAIANILTYIFLHPDSLAVVKLAGTSPQYFMFVDLFGIHDIEYAKTHSYASSTNVIKGTFMWDRNEGSLNMNKFFQFVDAFSKYFDHTHQHHFLMFDNPYEGTVAILQTLFNNRIDNRIRIMDLYKDYSR